VAEFAAQADLADPDESLGEVAAKYPKEARKAAASQIGYARVSTNDQNRGDILVAWRLDRLGRSLRHLITLAVKGTRKEVLGFRPINERAIDTTCASGAGPSRAHKARECPRPGLAGRRRTMRTGDLLRSVGRWRNSRKSTR